MKHEHPLNQVEINDWVTKLNSMSQLELGRLFRFANPGHPVFTLPELYKVFDSLFKGMTTELSKEIGWDVREYHES